MSVVDGASILHADLDAFYASVEVRDDPRLKAKPVAVGGGVVLAATYEARRHGVTAGISTGRARALCPGLVSVPARFSAYVEASRNVMSILEDFTPEIEPISIDEAFLEVAGSVHLLGTPPQLAEEIRRRVRSEVGLPISVGVASTKHLAKIASQVAKPDGLVVVPAGAEEEFLHPLPVRLLWGVGPVGESRLARYGIHTVGDLAAMNEHAISGWMGPHWGRHLWDLAHNVDPRRVDTRHTRKSIGAQSAGDATDAESRHTRLLALADRVAGRLRRAGKGARRTTTSIRLADMTRHSRTVSLLAPTAETILIYRTAAATADALVSLHAGTQRVTLVSVSASALVDRPHLQLQFPLGGADPLSPGTPSGRRQQRLDQAVDRVRDRFGRDAVRHAAILARPAETRSPLEEMEGAGE